MKSLLDELAVEAVLECERAIAQARRHYETGERTPDGAGWETCFRVRFRQVLEKHGLEPAPAKEPVGLRSQEQLEGVLEGIKMVGTRFQDWSFDWSVTQAKTEFGEGWHIQSSFERPDVDGVTPALTRGFGRKWSIQSGASRESVVFTAWLAIRQIVEHVLHESFTVTVDGEQVRLLDAHKRLEDVAVGSRRV